MDREEREWVAKEDDFVLKQAKKKARIRVREGRAKPIDWLAVVLAVVDLDADILEDEGAEFDLDIADPTAVVDELDLLDLRALAKDIDHYSVLEKSRSNLRFWRALKVLCTDRINHLAPVGTSTRGALSVSADVARLLGPKSKPQLEVLEDQVRTKLRSDEDIDVEYWEHLLESIAIFKAKVELSGFYKTVLQMRLHKASKDQVTAVEQTGESTENGPLGADIDLPVVNNQVGLGPLPMLKIPAAGKSSNVTTGTSVLTGVTADRQRIQGTGYVPIALRGEFSHDAGTSSRVAAGDASQTTNAMYDREAARGVEEDEEIFTAEAEVPAVSSKKWDGAYKPRKPKYFNRVQTGYDWNKYNQTHYDQENPPPKVVQGYKFNIFYPDLVDKTKAPTYKIQREDGRKRGESFAPAGEEDTCIIRFISGPPYEDLAFRIVDKEWDYSARRERGFKSSFDKGILQLHFQFKKVYYRK